MKNGTSSSGKFILIIVRAIRLMTCFVHRNLPKLRVTEGECGDFIAAAGEVLEAHGEYVVMREERRRRERETRESDEANELAKA